MDSGLAAVIGAGVGALSSLVAAAITSATARADGSRRDNADRQRWLMEQRKDAYADLIARSNELQMGWWALDQELRDPDRDAQRCEEMFREVTELWAPFVAASAIVQVVGPGAVADAAGKLTDAAHTMDELGTLWYRAVMDGRRSQSQGRYEQQRDEVDKRAGDLVDAARAAFEEPSARLPRKRQPAVITREASS